MPHDNAPVECHDALMGTTSHPVMTRRKQRAAEIASREAELRQRQSEYDRARAAAAKKSRQPPVSKAERALRAELAALESERAHLDGTAQSARQDADIW